MPGVITLDGPSASGKSSVAREVARRLGVPYLSSGLLYRALALLALERGLDPGDEEALLKALEATPIRLLPHPQGNRVLLGGVDRTGDLHTEAVDRIVSQVARHPGVRAWVNRSLRALPPPFVAEGRDMGLRVFPEAPYKFFLTASPEVRAERRAKERGEDPKKVLAELLRRDREDEANTRPAPDALILDTSGMGLEEVVAWILERIGARVS